MDDVRELVLEAPTMMSEGLFSPIGSRAELFSALREVFLLDWRGIHGAPHWSRVRHIGLRLAERTGARPDVVELFALLHDVRRIHERRDPNHGPRAADFALAERGRLFAIDDAGLELLVTALAGHSDGQLEADVTVQTCWDADRLDLGRLGIRPLPELLCTPAARDPAMIEWAFAKTALTRARWTP